LTVREDAQGRGREGGKRGGWGYSAKPFTDEIRRRSLGSPARDFFSMAASPVRIPEGERRGECGLNGKGVKEGEAFTGGSGAGGVMAGGFSEKKRFQGRRT
jgi:hypothetical protein